MMTEPCLAAVAPTCLGLGLASATATMEWSVLDNLPLLSDQQDQQDQQWSAVVSSGQE